MALGRKNIEVNDHTDQFLEYLDKAIVNGLTAIGMTAEGHAKKAITNQKAVDTGRLRNSITYALAGEKPHVTQYRGYKRSEGEDKRKIYSYDGTAPGEKGDGVYIGTNVEYAPYVELGTRKMRARPFLKPAATEHNDEYKKIREAALKSAEE